MTNKFAYILVINLALNICVLTSCSKLTSLTIPSDQATAPKVPAPPYIPPAAPEYKDFENEIRAKLKARDFAGLEELAMRCRVKKERFTGGSWKIHLFYEAVSAPLAEQPSDADWERHLALLREWKEKQIDSITPRVALAMTYLNYGEEARGIGLSNTVSRENWQLFEERNGKANLELNEAMGIKEKCQGYYEVWLQLGLAQSWSHDSFDKFFDQAVSYEPYYQYFYHYKTLYLQPKWHGNPGDWVKFADQVKSDLGAQEGLKMYYQIVTRISRQYGRDFLQQNQVSWKDTKKGFELFEQEFGMSQDKLQEFGRLATNAGDVEMICKIFERIGDADFDPEVWNSRKAFEQYRADGLQACQVLKAPKLGLSNTP